MCRNFSSCDGDRFVLMFPEDAGSQSGKTVTDTNISWDSLGIFVSACQYA